MLAYVCSGAAILSNITSVWKCGKVPIEINSLTNWSCYKRVKCNNTRHTPIKTTATNKHMHHILSWMQCSLNADWFRWLERTLLKVLQARGFVYFPSQKKIPTIYVVSSSSSLPSSFVVYAASTATATATATAQHQHSSVQRKLFNKCTNIRPLQYSMFNKIFVSTSSAHFSSAIDCCSYCCCCCHSYCCCCSDFHLPLRSLVLTSHICLHVRVSYAYMCVYIYIYVCVCVVVLAYEFHLGNLLLLSVHLLWFIFVARFWSLCVLSNNKCTFSPPKELIHKSLKRFMLHGQYAMMNKGQLMCIHTPTSTHTYIHTDHGGQVASGKRAERAEDMKTKSFFASVSQRCTCVCVCVCMYVKYEWASFFLAASFCGFTKSPQVVR